MCRAIFKCTHVHGNSFSGTEVTKIIIVIASKVSLRFSGGVNELMLSIYI